MGSLVSVKQAHEWEPCGVKILVLKPSPLQWYACQLLQAALPFTLIGKFHIVF